MALDSILTVAALTAGNSVVVPHTLSAKPNFIRPDRPTPIGVTACDATSVTFTNLGNLTESAFFHATRDHSIQQAGGVELFWAGYAGFASFKITPQWNDLLVPLTGLSGYGLNPPRLVSLANDGTVVPGSALLFNGTTSVAAIPDFGDFTLDYSLMFWINTGYAAAAPRNVLVKNATITVSMQSGQLRVQLQGMAVQTVPGIVLGAKNLVVIAVTKVAAAVTRLEVYINGVIRLTTSFPNALAADNANAWAVMATNHAGTMDEIRIYQAALTAAQALEMYNAGAGTENEPTGAPALLAGYHCNENAGVAIDNYEGTAARDGTLTNVGWTAGLVGAAGTPGVFGYQFDPGETQDLIFSAQMSHGWDGSDYEVHAHWCAPVLDGAATNIVIGLELQRCAIGGVWTAPTTLYTVTTPPNTTAANTHRRTGIGGMLPHANLGISHIIRGRVFRLGTGADTFPLPIIIDNIDFHYRADTMGSRQEDVK